ncbi:MAG: 16S rRNA (adenine(1518)-N(6)/adenine(1519)-N(6))-dimethyltransferase, partial [Methylobacter sp.]
VVTQAFSQRRKTLRNSLKKLIDEQDIAKLGIDPTARAETLSLGDFANLSNILSVEALEADQE